MLPAFSLVGAALGAILSALAAASAPQLLRPVEALLATLAAAGLGGLALSLAYWFAMMPAPARVFAYAEARKLDVLELVTLDNRSIFIPVKIVEGSIIVPADRGWREKLVVVTTPDAATPIPGTRIKLVRAIVDHPNALSPEFISVVVDFRRRYGFETLAELLEADRYYRDKESLSQLAGRLREELARLECGEGEYGSLPQEERERLRWDLEQQLKVFEKLLDNLPEGRPVAVVRGRVWTADDLLGWLGYRLPSTALRQLAKLKEVEGFLRATMLGREYMKYAAIAVIAIVAVVALVILYAMATGHAPAAAKAG